MLRGGDDNFGVVVPIDDGVDTQACDGASGVTTSGTTGNFATTMLRGGDNNFGVVVSIDDGVDTQACNAASGVTTSGTTGNFATTVLREVTTTLELTFLLTMELTHKHVMRLQASQPVAPPAILPPPCCAENELYENSFFLLTHHCLVCVWQRPWA